MTPLILFICFLFSLHSRTVLSFHHLNPSTKMMLMENMKIDNKLVRT